MPAPAAIPPHTGHLGPPPHSLGPPRARAVTPSPLVWDTALFPRLFVTITEFSFLVIAPTPLLVRAPAAEGGDEGVEEPVRYRGRITAPPGGGG